MPQRDGRFDVLEAEVAFGVAGAEPYGATRSRFKS
jgi:hypothetical protein